MQNLTLRNGNCQMFYVQKIEDVSICASGTKAVTDTSTCTNYADMLRSDGGKLSNDAKVTSTRLLYSFNKDRYGFIS